jgi:hypothetical protein
MLADRWLKVQHLWRGRLRHVAGRGDTEPGFRNGTQKGHQKSMQERRT